MKSVPFKPVLVAILAAMFIPLVTFHACVEDGQHFYADVYTGPCRFNSQCQTCYDCIDGGCFLTDPDSGCNPYNPKIDGGKKDAGQPDAGSKDGGGGKDAGPGSCLDGTCIGCCNIYNYCIVNGTQDTACGTNSEQCVDCTASGAICYNYVCVKESNTCLYKKCTSGCCDMDRMCQNGYDTFACGLFGADCVDCSLMGKQCFVGQCM